jgi:hypothetical protein
MKLASTPESMGIVRPGPWAVKRVSLDLATNCHGNVALRACARKAFAFDADG